MNSNGIRIQGEYEMGSTETRHDEGLYRILVKWTNLSREEVQKVRSLASQILVIIERSKKAKDKP
jgi:hypothetical protein